MTRHRLAAAVAVLVMALAGLTSPHVTSAEGVAASPPSPDSCTGKCNEWGSGDGE